MFKKIEIWILYLTLLIGVVLTIIFGHLVKKSLEHEYYSNRTFLQKVSIILASLPSNFQTIFLSVKEPGNEFIRQLDIKKDKLTKYKSIKRNEMLLLSRFNPEKNRSIVEIIDLNTFEVLHSYEPNINKINSYTDTSREEFRNLLINNSPDRYYIWNPLIDENGNLFFNSYSPFVKIGFCSEIIWINDEDNFHHSSNFDNNKDIWVPSSIFPFQVDKKYVGENFLYFKDDGISKISRDGKILLQKSVSQIFIENGYKHLLFGHEEFKGDPIHLNDIQPVLKDTKFFKEGDLFLSLRNLSYVILYRPSTNKIIKIISGPFSNQHDVDIISDKEISIFNNNTINGKNDRFVEVSNQVIIFDFETNEFSYKFKQQLENLNAETTSDGLSEILEDGSLFVDLRNEGRLLMIDSSGDLEWEYYNLYEEKTYDIWWSRIIKDKKMINSIYNKISNSKC